MVHVWHVDSSEPTVKPPEWGQGTLTPSQWRRVFNKLKHFIDLCTTIPGANTNQKLSNFKSNQSVEGPPPNPQKASPDGERPQLDGPCCIPKAFLSTLQREEDLSFLKFCTRGPKKGHNMGYFRVLANSMLPNTGDIYLHRLLRWMYAGPAADASLDCAHLCEHKLCICPWHMAFVTRSANAYSGHRKRKRM